MHELRVDIATPSRRSGWNDPREVRLLVDGRPLAEHLGRELDVAGLTPAELPPGSHLLGSPRADLSIDGRTALLICPLCGDLGCGAVLAHIELSSDRVVWSDFVFANDHDPDADEPLAGHFEFDRHEYEAALRGAER